MKYYLIITLGLLTVPLSAYPQKQNKESGFNGITHGVSASILQLNLMDEGDNVIGLNANYVFSIPIKTRFLIRTGIGYSHFWDQQKNINQTIQFHPEYDSESSIENETDSYTLKEKSLEYNYISVPANLGFKLFDKSGFTVTPYVGILVKYNLSYIKKFKYDSYSYYDLFINIYDDKPLIGSDAKKFMLQYDLELEIGYKLFYGIISYEKDFSRLYNTVYYSKKFASASGLNKPDIMSNWRLGLGFRF
ncbi:MAG: hypothetical protein J6P66_06440 [Bacteroidaceae bacterium]|nr:hypothetical protein [Bacteroidaceae bacterium]